MRRKIRSRTSPRSDVVHPVAALLELKWRLLLLKANAGFIDARQHNLTRVESQIDDAVEVGRTKRANGGLGAAGNSALVIEQTSFGQAVGPVEWNRIDEIEISPGLNQCEIHAWRCGVGNDTLDFGNSEIATGIVHLAGLVVDDPIADASFDATQILARELVLLSGAVVVD